MALLTIVTYPDPILLQPTKPIEKFDESLKKLANDMIETMNAANGVGLAANQVNVGLQIGVICLAEDRKTDAKNKEYLIFANPKIIERSHEVMSREGCLSLPDFSEEVERFEELTVEFLDTNNIIQRKKLAKLPAIAFQHELDHLNGITLLNHVSKLKVQLYRKQLQKKV
jgi:peptide deformylase